MIEFFLLLTLGTIGYNIYRTKKLQKRFRVLEAQNSSLTETLFLPPAYSEEEFLPHMWEKITVEPIHYSVFTMDPVNMQVEKCIDCGLIHRYIKDGFHLAKSKGLTGVEGYYRNGTRCEDNGCRALK